MTTVIRETAKFQLLEGEGAGKGCYKLFRKEDKSDLDWYCGQEAVKWAERLLKMSPRKFDEACEAEFAIV